MLWHGMASDAATAPDPGEVMASVDEPSERLIIADITREDAWLAVPLADAVSIGEWQ